MKQVMNGYRGVVSYYTQKRKCVHIWHKNIGRFYHSDVMCTKRVHRTQIYLSKFNFDRIFVHYVLSLIILFYICACCDTRCFKTFVYSCLSKSRSYRLMLHAVQYLTQNKISMSMHGNQLHMSLMDCTYQFIY